MTNLLTWNYWFNLQPEALLPFAQKLFMVAIIILAISAIIIALIKNHSGIYHGFLNRLYFFFLANTLIGLLFFAFNYEFVPFFSARFWLGLWIILMLVWLFFILKKLRAIPVEKKQLAKEEELKKYLP